MKQLKDFINESVLNGIEDTMNDNISDELIINWINENWSVEGELNVKFDGKKYVVDCNGSVRHPRTNKITNGAFVWGNVTGDFLFTVSGNDIQNVKSLKDVGLPQFVGGLLTLINFTKVTNLEGLPDNVGSLRIAGFTKLNSLKGCPTNVKREFTISQCSSLKGLDYLPKYIGGGIDISWNKNLLSIDGLSAVTNVVNGNLFLNGNYKLKSLEGCPSTVNGMFSIEKCKSLTSLEGFPEYVDSHIYCKHCGTRFTQDQIRAICGQRIGYKVDAYKTDNN